MKSENKDKESRSGEADNVIESVELSDGAMRRIRAMQYINSAPDRSSYLSRQRTVAKQLGMTIRNVQRLMQQWRSLGVGGIIRHERKDRGGHRVNKEWYDFIVKTYRQGNRGSGRMSRAQVAVRVAVRGKELGIEDYPSRATVYRILGSEIEKEAQKKRKRCLGWQGEKLILKTRCGLEIEIVNSNQVWQCDHTKLDIFVVSQSGEVLGRPWLTTVVDTHSRCVVGTYLGMEARSSDVVCLALRHAILPKNYSGGYGLRTDWGTYGVPQYLYTDGGKEFNSNHLERVASELKIVLCQRRYPSEGGIVERPFGTLNSELLSTLPGYTGSNVKQRPKQAEKSASLTLEQLDRLIVRYIVERYNQSIDPRIGNQTRLGRWEEGRIAQLALLSDRELDICLMRRSKRVVYRGGYIQFSNLTYKGEHLEGYTGEWVVLRYNPRDITSILIYQMEGSKERFLTRAHAMGLETEALSLAEAEVMSRRLRKAGRLVTNQSIYDEVRARDVEVKEQQRRKRKRKTKNEIIPVGLEQDNLGVAESRDEVEDLSDESLVINVPDVRVHDYEEWKQESGM